MIQIQFVVSEKSDHNQLIKIKNCNELTYNDNNEKKFCRKKIISNQCAQKRLGRPGTCNKIGAIHSIPSKPGEAPSEELQKIKKQLETEKKQKAELERQLQVYGEEIEEKETEQREREAMEEERAAEKIQAIARGKKVRSEKELRALAGMEQAYMPLGGKKSRKHRKKRTKKSRKHLKKRTKRSKKSRKHRKTRK